MLGFIIFLMLIGIEIVMLILRLKTKSNQVEAKNKISLITFVIMILLALFQIIQLSFRWYLIFIVLLIQAVIAIVYFLKKSKNIRIRKEKSFKTSSAIFTCIRRIVLFGFSLFLAMMFPQYKDLPVTGEYDVATAIYTLEDTTRIETYSTEKENRKVTIEFWYPKIQNNEKTFPLVIFSHGSFGFRGSNYSTFMELASNGYVVCSIDHTYYSFFTKQTDGKMVTVNQKFINDAIAVQNNNYNENISYDLTHQWLDTRLADMNMVMDTILQNITDKQQDDVYQMIDTEKIGVFGHSIGGATAAQLGRNRKDIDAVIVIDGTLLGEAINFVDGKEILIEDAYPIPILDIFNEEHYQNALENKSVYANMVMANNAAHGKQTVFKKAGHLNFTDLPMFSPFLADILGTGDINSRDCIETMNQIVLSYFNYYLKEFKELNIQAEY